MKDTITIVFITLSVILYGETVSAQFDTNGIVIYSECANIEEFDATFEGGIERFREWVHNELLNSEDVSEYNKLIVILLFVVNTDGSISDIEVVESNHIEISEKLIKVIADSPSWRPKGISVNGTIKYYRQRFKIPISIEFK